MPNINMFKPMPPVNNTNLAHTTSNISELSTIQAALDEVMNELKKSGNPRKKFDKAAIKKNTQEVNRFQPMPSQTVQSGFQDQQELKERLFSYSQGINEHYKGPAKSGVKNTIKPWNNPMQNPSHQKATVAPSFKWSRESSKNRFIPMPESHGKPVYSQDTRVFSPQVVTYTNGLSGKEAILKTERVPLYQRTSSMHPDAQTYSVSWPRLLPPKPQTSPCEIEMKVVMLIINATPEAVNKLYNKIVQNPFKFNS